MLSSSPCASPLFLSTPPSRVATVQRCVFFAYGRGVSIHATLAGGDRLRRFPRRPPYAVSIHATLAGGDAEQVGSNEWGFGVSIHATLAGGDCGPPSSFSGYRKVSIHATLAGGDLPPASSFPADNVSIHATLAGGDRRGETLPHRRRGCFYPRHPRGWRPDAGTARIAA